MREFFRGWRRKTGVVTLVMACATLAVWLNPRFHETTIARYGEREGGMVFTCSTIELSDYGIVGGRRSTNVDCGMSYLDVTWSIPYWTLSTPLNLLSAYLLLNKPRPAKKPEASPPLEPDHA